MSTNAIIYARVSSKEQETGGYSIPAQIDFLTNYAKQKSFNIIKTFTESVSAKDKNCRAEYDNMIAFAKKQKGGCHILVEKTDRLLRNEFNSAEIIELARTTNITIHLAKEGLTLEKNSPPTAFFMFTMFTANSSLYPRNLSNEVKKGMNKKAELGYYPDKAPVGYKNVRQSKKHSVIEIDAEKAPFVKRAFELFATENYSMTQIASILASEGFKIKTRLVHTNSIETILKNPFYIGDFIYNGIYYKGKHQPIIEKALFFQVQKIIEKKHAPRINKYDFLFNGLIECSHCGKFLTADIKKGKYVYYRCFSKNCKIKAIPEHKIEKAVIENLQEISVTPKTKADIISKIKAFVASEMKYNTNLAEDNNRKIINLNKKLEMLYNDKLDNVITSDFFQKQYEKWNKEITMLQKQSEEISKSYDDLINKCELILELLEQAPSLFLRLNKENKRIFLKTIYSNFFYNGETVTIKTKRAFDLLYKRSFNVMVGPAGFEPATKGL